MKSISEIQDEIISEFSLLDGDMEMTVFYIMELGQKLPDVEYSHLHIAIEQREFTYNFILNLIDGHYFLFHEIDNPG